MSKSKLITFAQTTAMIAGGILLAACGGGGGGGPNENGTPLLPPTAELKVLKSQQVRVNEMTKEFDLDRTAEADLSPEQKQACDHIAEKQRRVAEFARDLHERLNKER